MNNQPHATTDLAELFERLSRSAFRTKFKLAAKDHAYLQAKGMDAIARHAADFITGRIAPAHPKNDGRQTPLRGHPVFVAQHATATCCRGCIATWHGIAKGRELSAYEQRRLVDIILSWLDMKVGAEAEKNA